jgi:GTP-binding protein HflX
MVPAIAIAGYTNAGKSSLMNLLTGAGVLVEDALFATLDPTVRKARLSDGRPVLLTDTVGFVRHLPHQLVEAFRSTLEEVAAADLVLHIVDGAHPDPESQLSAVREVLADVGAADIPELVVINKIDAADPLALARLARHEPHAVFVSALTREGLPVLAEALVEAVPHLESELDVLVPYDHGELVARMHKVGEVLSEQFVPEGTRLTARVGPRLAAQLEPYVVATA